MPAVGQLEALGWARGRPLGAAACFFLCLAPLEFHRTQLWAVRSK